MLSKVNPWSDQAEHLLPHLEIPFPNPTPHTVFIYLPFFRLEQPLWFRQTHHYPSYQGTPHFWGVAGPTSGDGKEEQNSK